MERQLLASVFYLSLVTLPYAARSARLLVVLVSSGKARAIFLKYIKEKVNISLA